MASDEVCHSVGDTFAEGEVALHRAKAVPRSVDLSLELVDALKSLGAIARQALGRDIDVLDGHIAMSRPTVELAAVVVLRDDGGQHLHDRRFCPGWDARARATR